MKTPAKLKSVTVSPKQEIANIESGDPREIIESVLIRGDLSKMDPSQRTDYYMRVCQSVGLNPLTKPFEYIVLNGKLTLYARRDCTDQLRAIHNVSVVSMDESDREGVHIVKCKVQNANERTDISTGGVSIVGLKGEALANALMKAETKAKRRATLSICGLGFLDETEIADIPEASKQRVPSPSEPPPNETPTMPMPIEGEVIPPEKPKAAPKKAAVPSPSAKPEPAPKQEAPADEPAKPERLTPHELIPDENSKSFPTWASRYIAAIAFSIDLDELKAWREKNKSNLAKLGKNEEQYGRVTVAEQHMADNLSPAKPAETMQDAEEMAGETVSRATTADMPDVEKDPDAFVKWAIKIIGTFKDMEGANEWYAEIVTPLESKMFPPDVEEVQAGLRRLEEKLAP